MVTVNCPTIFQGDCMRPDKFLARDGKHFYSYEGVDHPSVTTILSVIDKPLLTRWKMKQAALAAATAAADMVKLNPSGKITKVSLKEIADDAMDAPDNLAGVEARVGTAVHELAWQASMLDHGVGEVSDSTSDNPQPADKAVRTAL